jgi:hypothetical protein
MKKTQKSENRTVDAAYTIDRADSDLVSQVINEVLVQQPKKANFLGKFVK